ncbi:unnamed protein product [Rhizophagus irregularis]|nr:unnamed protein product [Rhizophagus irregularis]
MDAYSEQQGFENKKVRVEKDKYGQIKKCSFRVNFSYTKSKGFISITSYNESHVGHALELKFVDFHSKYRHMTDDMMKQIRTFTKCNLDLAQQRSMLKEMFPDRTILS